MRKLIAKVSARQRTKERALQAKKQELWVADLFQFGFGICQLCFQPIREYSDCAAAHIKSRGMGGGKRDDSQIVLAHHRGNMAQGSVSLAKYLELPLETRRRNCGIA